MNLFALSQLPSFSPLRKFISALNKLNLDTKRPDPNPARSLRAVADWLEKFSNQGDGGDSANE